MLTIDQISETAKNKIIKILNDEGIDKTSVGCCIYGLACENLGVLNLMDAENKIDDITKNVADNKRQYALQVLTIYGNYVAERFFGGTILRQLTPEQRLQAERIVGETAEEWLPKII